MIEKFFKSIFLFRGDEVDRKSWVKKHLAKVNKGENILDAGCGSQQYKKYCNHLKYHSQDFAKYDGKGDGKGLQTGNYNYGEINYIGDIWKINEQDSFFDNILCTEVLEHIPYPNETISEFSRLLKQGGVLFLTAPVCSIPHFSPYYYYNGFADNYYKEMAKLNSFEIISIKENGNVFEYLGVEAKRSVKNVKQPIKLIYALFVFLFIFVLKCMSKTNLENHRYLHSGYHVIMKKI